MVPEQVLRAARRLTRACAAAVAVAAVVAAGARARAEPVVVLDLRPDPADDGFAAAVNALPELSLRGGEALAAALRGQPPAGTRAAGEAALAEARAAYGDLACRRASEAAGRAVVHLAAARAAAKPAKRPRLADLLTRAHVYELQCAHGGGRAADAQRAADRLRRLGHESAPEGISDEVWSRYPAMDAAGNVLVTRLRVATEPPGAVVWVDHRPVGNAPAEVFAPEGPHIVAAAGDGGREARRARAVAPETAVTLPLTPRPDPWRPVRERVAGWRRGGREPTPVDLAELLARLEVRIALVRVRGGDDAQVWGVAPDARVASLLATVPTAEPTRAARAVAERVETWEPRAGPGIQPGVPLLREDPSRRGKDDRADEDGPAWWVYASIGGAVALGAGFILLNDLATDRQRIELTWP